MLRASTGSVLTTRRSLSTRGAAAPRRRPVTTSSCTSPSWEATLDLEAGTAELSADGSSLRVQKGTGGMMELGDEDKENIHKTIDDEVLEKRNITFRSTSVEGARRAATASTESSRSPARRSR